MPTPAFARRLGTFATAFVILGALASVFLYTSTRSANTTYYSQGSLPPNLLTSWNSNRAGGGSVPLDFTTAGDTFVIQNTHNMGTAATWSVTGAGAKIQIESGGTLTANNIVAVPNFQVDNGGTYIHNATSGSANGTAADIPGSTSRAFGASSNETIQLWATAASTAPVALPAVSWGNLTINVPTFGGSWNQQSGLTTVQGNLTIQATGGTTRELRLANATDYTLTIGGNLNVSGGILNTSNASSASKIINLGGNFNQTGGTFTSSTGTTTINFTGGTSLVGFTQSAGTFTNTNINWSIANGKTVQFNNAFTLATSRTFTINSGGMLLAAATITNNGTMTVNGEFRLTDGGFATGSNFTYGAASTLGFVSSGSYVVNGTPAYWPTSSGPPNVNVLGGGMTLNVARTVTGGVVQTSAGISSAGNLTIGPSTTFQINTGGFVSGSPTYSLTSTLKYNTGGSYGRAGEWLATSSGAGYPYNVQVSNNTTLNADNGGLFNTATSQLAGNLVIDAGSTLSMGAMTQAIKALNAVSLLGTLTLSSSSGGDLELQGNWTNSGTFNPNGRAVIFSGGVTQLLSRTGGGGETFNYLVVNKTANSLTLTADVVVNGTSGDVLQLLGGSTPLELGTRTLTLSGAGGNVLVSGGARAVTATSGASNFTFSGAKTVTGASGGTLSFNANVTVNLSAAVNFGAGLSTVNHKLSVKTGGSVNTNPPAYASGSTLEYDNGTTYNASAEFPSTGVQNVTLASTTQLNLNGDKTVAGTFSAGANSVGTTGASPFSLSAASIGVSTGTLNLNNVTTGSAFNVTGAASVNVAGNWNVNGFTAGASTVNFNGTGPQTIQTASTFNNLTTSNDVTLGASPTVGGTLALGSKKITTGANTLNVGGAAVVTRTTGYVVGTLLKNFSGASNFTFDVGTANGYSPVDANVTAGAGSLSVNPTQTKHPNVAGTNALARYWTLAGSGVTANLTFHYLAGDVAGTESNYKIFKYTGGTFTQFEPNALDTTNHTATLNGVSSFSDWTLAEAASVYGSLQFSSAAYSTAEGDSGSHNVTVTVTRSGGSSGAVSVHYATSDGTATTANNDYTAASGDLNWADGETADKTFNVSVNGDTSFEPDESVNLTLSSPTGGATLGTPNTSVLTVTNDDAATISGTKTVCASGCDYTSLTGAGGLFAAVNAATVSGNLVAEIGSDLVEDGTNALNQWTESGAGNYTLTIQPSGAATKTISGAVSAVMIRLDGADRVTIDGRFGGAGRFLTFRNTHPSGATVALSNDATSNTLRNSVVEGAASAIGTGVVFFGGGVTTGNDNNTVTDNQIRDRSDAPGVPLNLILSSGTAGAAANSNNTVSDNELFNFLNRAVNVSGLVAGSSESWTVTGNNVYQTAARTGTLLGISVGAAGSNIITGNTVHDLTTSGPIVRGINFVPTGSGTSTITRNRVHSLTNTTGNTETSGMVVSPQDTTTVNVVNNMVSVIPSGGNDQGVYGFYEQGVAGTTLNFSYNSVLVGGTSTGTTPSWACARNTAPTASVSTWRDNICFNNRTGGGANHFAAGNQSTGGSFSSDYNVFVGTGAGAASDFMDYGTVDTGTPVSFATWQSSTGGDAHSLAANPGGDYTVANMFTSATDLHLNIAGTNPASNAGTPVAGVTTDYDNETRDTVIPDIGIDEVTSATSLQFSSAAYSVGEGAGFVTITVTRTGSSVGAVAVQYVTSDGTAAAGADYEPLSDGLVWLNGDASPKTFNVTINNDALYEVNETFNVTLNAPSGATLGTPSTTTVTIIDNDAAPTVSVGDVTVAEPTTGITYAVFPVTLSAASGVTTSVNFATSDGTATQPGDYASASGTLSFVAGETSKTIAVIVKADAVSDTPETFNLNLSSPSNATVADGTGVATITAPVGAGTVLISEFRLRGPGDPNAAPIDTDAPVIMQRTARKGGRPVADTGDSVEPNPSATPPVVIVGGGDGGGPSAPPFPPETDEFIEVYNNTDADIIVSDANPVTCAAQVITLGLSPTQACGWALVDLQGSVSNVPRFVIPVGTTIPARGHYLAASTGYSLGALAAPDLTYSPPAYSGGEADYTGLALFRTADRAQFTPSNVFDAVGFDGVASPFREGTGLLPLVGVGEDVQFSFVRNQTSSRPSDTGDNRADFTLVATTPSLLLSGTATLGAPGPENTSGLVSRNDGFAVTIPPSVAASLRNNTTVTNGSLGTLSLRRRFTNNTGQSLSRLRFRVVNLTTYNSKQIFSNQAEVRLLDAQLTGLGGTGLLATTVETPPAQTSGGGVNSGLLVSGSLTLAQPLAAGQSVDVEFLLGVMKSGSYQFVVIVEGAQ